MRRVDLTPGEIDIFNDLYVKGYSIRDIAPWLDMNPTTLSFRLRRAGVKLRDAETARRMPRAKAKVVAKLTSVLNPNYKGGGAQPHTGRGRAAKLYPTIPEHCARCGCHRSETKRMEKHHKDKNPLNNHLDNIDWLCAKCHKAVHPHPRWGH